MNLSMTGIEWEVRGGRLRKGNHVHGLMDMDNCEVIVCVLGDIRALSDNRKIAMNN